MRIAISVVGFARSSVEKRGSNERGSPFFFLSAHSLKNVERLFIVRLGLLSLCIM